jgi:hypothetical protein
MTCIEEASRIGSLTRRTEEAIKSRFSLPDLEKWLWEMDSGRADH